MELNALKPGFMFFPVAILGLRPFTSNHQQIHRRYIQRFFRSLAFANVEFQDVINNVCCCVTINR